MKGDEARLLLGFPPDSRPTPSQVKAAYKKKVWESHPDCFPVHEKTHAESKFKLISEAYACLHSGRNRGQLALYGACRRRFSLERRSFIMRWNNSMEMKMMRMRWMMLMQRWGKRYAEVVTLAGVVEPLDVNHAAADAPLMMMMMISIFLMMGNGLMLLDLVICCVIYQFQGARGEGSAPGSYAHVVRTGVPRAHGGRRNHALIRVPFLFIILGTVALGGLNATRAYKRQKEAYPSHNPFLP